MIFFQFLKFVVFVGVMIIILFVYVQDEDVSNGWSGEGLFSVGMIIGNIEIMDIGFGIDVVCDINFWKIGLKVSVDYGEIDGDEIKNWIFLGINVDCQLIDKLFGFGQFFYECDEFLGFELCIFIGGGFGYEIFGGDVINWNVCGGFGLKIDEIEVGFDMLIVLLIVVIFVCIEELLGVIVELNFLYLFNENVIFINDIMVLYVDMLIQIGNIVVIMVLLINILLVCILFEVCYDIDLVDGFEVIDMISCVFLVYGFGK